jgi:hypothetical protein
MRAAMIIAGVAIRPRTQTGTTLTDPQHPFAGLIGHFDHHAR